MTPAHRCSKSPRSHGNQEVARSLTSATNPTDQRVALPSNPFTDSPPVAGSIVFAHVSPNGPASRISYPLSWRSDVRRAHSITVVPMTSGTASAPPQPPSTIGAARSCRSSDGTPTELRQPSRRAGQRGH